MNQNFKTAISVLLFVPIYLLLYTLLHEGGHALVILAHGGKIDKFSLGLNAHVSSHGGEFTVFGTALNYIAGMLLPIIIGAIAISLY
ncbi:MAG TPA: M50 family metallopeptidase, partial [Syntrophomonas sp.]|nr:M50 family metallopeptidase [Syntrophomonas sp.]